MSIINTQDWAELQAEADAAWAEDVWAEASHTRQENVK